MKQTKKRGRHYKNKTVRGGYFGQTLREASSAKFLITRIINPANPDRLLYKNAFFLQFIDEEKVKLIYPKESVAQQNAAPIPVEIVEQCGSYYIYKKSYLDPNNTLYNTELKMIENVKKPFINASETFKNVKDTITNKLYSGELPSNTENPLNGNNNTSNVEEKAAADKLEKEEDKQDEKEEATKEFILDKPRNCFSVSDTLNRKSFSPLNDAPLVDRELIENESALYSNCICFAKDFDVLYKIFHIYKYQINRVLWTPSEMIYFKRISYLLHSIYTMINNNDDLKSQIKEELKMTLLISSLMGSSANEFAVNGDNTSKVVLENEIKQDDNDTNTDNNNNNNDTNNDTNTNQNGGGLSEINITGILLKFYDIDPPFMNTNSLKYSLLTKKFPPFMKREAIYALQTAIELLQTEKNINQNTYFENPFVVKQEKVRETVNTKRESSISNTDLTGEIKTLIIELYKLNPGKDIQGGNKTRRYRRNKNNRKTKRRGGGWLSDKLTSARNVASDKLTSVRNVASNTLTSARTAASNTYSSVKDKVKSTETYKFLNKQKMFFTAIQDIFDECYKSMVDKYLNEVSNLSMRTDITPLPKNKTMKEHVAKFFLILHDCTFNKMFQLFQNTIFFNALNFYNPLVTMGPTLMTVPGLGPITAGAMLLTPTVHLLCSMRLMASEFKNASILLNENEIEKLRRIANPQYISIYPNENLVDKVKISDIASKMDFYKDRVFYIETKALSHYAKIVGVDMSDPVKCKLTVKYIYDESKDKILEKTKLEKSDEDIFITSDTLIQPVYGFINDDNDSEINNFFDKTAQGNSSLSPDFTSGLQNKMKSLLDKTISLNDKFLGKVIFVEFVKKNLSLSNLKSAITGTNNDNAVYKNVEITFSIGNKGSGPDKYKETTYKIKYNEIGLKGEVGKKWFKIIKIVDYDPTASPP